MCNIMNLYMYICCKSFKVYHPPFFLASSAPKSPNFTTNIHTQDAPPPKKKKNIQSSPRLTCFFGTSISDQSPITNQKPKKLIEDSSQRCHSKLLKASIFRKTPHVIPE